MLSVMEKARLPKLVGCLLLTSSIALWSYGCAQPQKVPQPGSGYGEPISGDAGPEAPVEQSMQQPSSEAKPASKNKTAEKPVEEGMPKAKEEEPKKLPPLKPTSARQLAPLEDVAGQFTEEEGKQKGKVYNFTYELSGDGIIQNIEGLRRVYYVWLRDGSLAIQKEDNLVENVKVQYDPALRILPGKIDRTDFPKQVFDVIIHDLSNGNQRAKGRGTSTIEAVWQSRIKTPLGMKDVYIVREVRELDLDVAKVKVTLDTAYEPGEGEILQMEWQSRKPLNLFVENSSYKLLRTE